MSDKGVLTRSARTFRIFISSTFTDMKDERNALQERVFPRLHKLCAEHGCVFQAIDLRWGISDEAGREQQTMAICLEEIQRCQKTSPRPNFIVLLGDRYGWRPLPYEVPAEEFVLIEKDLVDKRENGLLHKWYLRDDNALQPVYCLQSREYVSDDQWSADERALRSIFNRVIKGTSMPYLNCLKYLGSATEQEIALGALQVQDANEHVFCYFKTDNISPWDSRSADYVDLDEDGNIDVAAKADLARLKDRIRLQMDISKGCYNPLIPDNIHKYEVDWSDEKGKAGYMDRLCEDVYLCLERVILLEIGALVEMDELSVEVRGHKEFGFEKARHFTGRSAAIKAISEYVADESQHTLYISGPSGSGKTALMAKASAQISSDLPEAVLIRRFVGATSSSLDCRSLIESICREISREYDDNEGSVPAELDKLKLMIPEKLALATEKKPLFVFIDALDQLADENGHADLSWLPSALPRHVKIIVSLYEDSQLPLISDMVNAPGALKIEPMSPKDGDMLLGRWLTDAGRRLTESQRAYVLEKFKNNGLPLYLRLAFEESRRWKSYFADDIKLSDDITGLIQDMLERLSAGTSHGKVLVSRATGYLAASRYGLSEDELLDVISRDRAIFKDFLLRSKNEPAELLVGIRSVLEIETPETMSDKKLVTRLKEDPAFFDDVMDRVEARKISLRLPVVLWSRLYFDLKPYLMDKNINGTLLITFYHRQVSEIVVEKYLSGDSGKAMHKALAKYFKNCNSIVRKAIELPWQLRIAEEWDELKDCLSDLDIFEELMTPAGKYELTSYWRALGDRYDMVGAYIKAIELSDIGSQNEGRLSYIYNQMGAFFEMNGQYNGAESLYWKSLAIAERLWGDTDPNTSVIVANIADIQRIKGNYGEAVKLLRRALSMTERIFGPEQPETALCLTSLASTMQSAGDYAGAESAYNRALLIMEHHFGPEHQETAVVANNLATLYQDMGDYVKAGILFHRALSIREKTLGSAHPVTIQSIGTLAALYQAKGEYADAEVRYRQILEQNLKTYGSDHPEVAQTLNNLGTVLEQLRNFGDAESAYISALRIREKSYGVMNPFTATTLNNLGSLKLKTKDYVDAERYLTQALSIREKMLPHDHPYTAYTLNLLGTLHLQVGDDAVAEQYLRRALAIREKTLGPYHPDVSFSLNSLAKLLSKNKDFDGAEALYKRTLEINEKSRGPNHPFTAIAANNIAVMLLTKGDLDGAEPFCRQALAINEKIYGPDHPSTINTRNNLNALYSLREQKRSVRNTPETNKKSRWKLW